MKNNVKAVFLADILKNKKLRRKILKSLAGIVFVLLLLTQCLLALSNPPKHEFRGAWIATVANIDWPKNSMDSPSKQKRDLIYLLDVLDEAGINAVILQVRPECDALYNSNYEPWSYWLTGRQGKAPQPYYDPLEFAIEEAHKRGMELHAWFNPFRAEKTIGDYPLAPNHVVNTHPEWILSFTETDTKLRILNPGIPDVRKYVNNVIMDVVNRYDVDGVHFDDYFYPYPPNEISKTNKDYSTYQNYKHGDASDNSINDWRRENINILIQMVNDSIQTVKPWVKFGISPFGIYRNGVPSGIVGMDAYSVIYCDPLAWLKNQSIDYLTPQLYWKIGGNQDFKKLVNWWADQAGNYNRHLYPGHIFRSSFSTNELPSQLQYVRNNSKAQGDVYFSAKHFDYNTLDFDEEVKADYYRYQALVPTMNWKTQNIPDAPPQFVFAPKYMQSTAAFQWVVPAGQKADSSVRFVLYRFIQSPADDVPPSESSYIYKIVGGTSFLPKPPTSSVAQLYFAVSAVNRNGIESRLSSYIEIKPPESPILALPKNGNKSIHDTFSVRWNLLAQASTYYLQIARDSLFNDLVVDVDGIAQDSLCIGRLEGQTKYFWRVAGENPAGKSSFSTPNSFKTAFPMEPLLASPDDGESDIPLDTVLTWYKNATADSYRVQLAQASTFVESYMVLDTVVTDTLVEVNNLKEFTRKWYYWRVKAINDYGQSDWSETFMFRTIPATYLENITFTPRVFDLKQNYPNPFNPTTTIEFSIPVAGQVSLVIYNMLGQKVMDVMETFKPAGNYKVQIDGTNLAAGVYVYQLRSGKFVANKKMILVK